MEDKINVNLGGQDPKILFNGLLKTSTDLRGINPALVETRPLDEPGKEKFNALKAKVETEDFKVAFHSGGYDQAAITLDHNSSHAFINVNSQGITLNNFNGVSKEIAQKAAKKIFQLCKGFGLNLDLIQIPLPQLTADDLNAIRTAVNNDADVVAVLSPVAPKAPAKPGFKITFPVGAPGIHSAEQIGKKLKYNHEKNSSEVLALDGFLKANGQTYCWNKDDDKKFFGLGKQVSADEVEKRVSLNSTDGEMLFELPAGTVDIESVNNYAKTIVATCKVLGIDLDTLNIDVANLPPELMAGVKQAFADAKKDAKDEKTAMGKLAALPPAPVFEPFLLDFSKMDMNNVAQAKAILDEARALKKRGHKKIGITYSANYGQTQKIRTTYAAPGMWKTETGGGAQAAVIAEVEKLLATEEYKDLQQEFRILPITTMEGGTAYAPKTHDQILQEDLDAIKTHLDNGGAVLGWQNQGANSKNKDGFTYAIGGNISKDASGGISDDQRKKVCAALTKFAQDYPAPKSKVAGSLKVEGKHRNAFGNRINKQLAVKSKEINAELKKQKMDYVFTPADDANPHHRLINATEKRTVEIQDNGEFSGESIQLDSVDSEEKIKGATKLLADDMKASMITLIAAGIKDPYDFSLTGIKPESEQQLKILQALKTAVYAEVRQWLQATYPDDCATFTVDGKAVAPEAKTSPRP